MKEKKKLIAYINYLLNRTSLLFVQSNISERRNQLNRFIQSLNMNEKIQKISVFLLVLLDILESQLYSVDQSIGLATTCARALYGYFAKK